MPPAKEPVPPAKEPVPPAKEPLPPRSRAPPRSPCLRRRNPCLRRRSPCLRPRSPCLRPRSPCLRRRSPCLRPRSPCLRRRLWRPPRQKTRRTPSPSKGSAPAARDLRDQGRERISRDGVTGHPSAASDLRDHRLVGAPGGSDADSTCAPHRRERSRTTRAGFPAGLFLRAALRPGLPARAPKHGELPSPAYIQYVNDEFAFNPHLNRDYHEYVAAALQNGHAPMPKWKWLELHNF